MKKTKALATTAAIALLATGCDVTTGTLNNQGAFGSAAVENEFLQIAYQTPERVRDLAEQFANTTPTLVNFDFNQTALDSEADRILSEQAEFIRRFPQVRFTVIGHTDAVGSNGFNQGLGLRRARAVVGRLIALGVDRKQLSAVASRGERDLIVTTQGPERLNRRTITTVAGSLQGFVGPDFDGKRALIVYNEYVGDTGSEVQLTEQ